MGQEALDTAAYAGARYLSSIVFASLFYGLIWEFGQDLAQAVTASLPVGVIAATVGMIISLYMEWART